MGRGLSPLQQTILRIAFRQHDQHLQHAADNDRNPDEFGCDVLYRDVLIEHYGFRRKAPRLYVPSDRIDRAAIGRVAYNRATAALSRAFSRLESRGLVCVMCGTGSRWSGANLTDEGLKIAGELSVKTRETFPNVNR